MTDLFVLLLLHYELQISLPLGRQHQYGDNRRLTKLFKKSIFTSGGCLHLKPTFF